MITCSLHFFNIPEAVVQVHCEGRLPHTAQVVVWLGDMPSSCGEDTSEELRTELCPNAGGFNGSRGGWFPPLTSWFFFFSRRRETKTNKQKNPKSLSESQIQTPPWSTFVSTWKARNIVLHTHKIPRLDHKMVSTSQIKSEKQNKRQSGWQKRGSPAPLVVNSCQSAGIKPNLW